MRNPEAVAWVVASEGSISLIRANYERSIAPVINVYTKEEFLTKFKDMVDDVGQIWTRGARKAGNAQSYEWSLNTYATCLNFLLEIYEYLPIKQEQANVVIDFCTRAIEQKRHISSGRYRPKPTQEDWDALDLIHHLNRKGGE